MMESSKKDRIIPLRIQTNQIQCNTEEMKEKISVLVTEREISFDGGTKHKLQRGKQKVEEMKQKY